MISPVPFIPDTAPFSPEQRAWLNGFLAGVFSRQSVGSQLAGAPAPATLQPLTILFASQTGTAESLAKKTGKEAGKRGFAPTILDMAQATPASLASEKNLLVITSTYGDGEPPDSAKSLHAALAASVKSESEISNPESKISNFPALRYSVCALGDTNYTLFCQCGKDFDAYLKKLGATRITPRADCNLDYEKHYTQWLDATLSALSSETVGAALRRDGSPESRDKPAPTPDEASGFSKKIFTPRSSSPSATSTRPAPPKRSTTSNFPSPIPASFMKPAMPSAWSRTTAPPSSPTSSPPSAATAKNPWPPPTAPRPISATPSPPTTTSANPPPP